MQIVSCPSCGAEVTFRSHAAVMAVCEFCRATVLKDADSVRDIGKMSAVLEDFSPIQIGTAGVSGGRNFTMIGRIQLRYAAGMWNEWFLLFDEGSTAWLGDSSGLFTLTSARTPRGPLPGFGAIEPGQLYTIDGERYTASEKRSATCIGGQGELPFRVGEGWEAQVADFRSGAAFLTLDYSDDPAKPAMYTGAAVTLNQLQCQLLRDDDQIKASAGRYRGKLDVLDCPSCGSGIKYLPGVTTHLVCPSCQAQLDAAGPEAQVLAAGERESAVRTTIALGASATINAQSWQVIGAMVRADEEQTEWTEYLLYNTRSAFFWLVETDEGWSRADVTSVWPAWDSTGADTATLDKVGYRKLYDYDARVQWAAGAFNWRVAAGDVVHVFEFESGQARLAAELNDSELTWSRSTPVAFDQIKAWFGPEVSAGAASRVPAPAGAVNRTLTCFMWWLLALNAIPLLFNFGTTLFTLVFAVAAIYVPSRYRAPGDRDNK